MRRHGTILVVAVCLLAAVVAIAYAAGKDAAPLVIRAQRFELVDGQGTVWAALEFGGPDKLPALEMYDEKGHTRVQLCVGPSGPGLDLMHKSGLRPGIAIRASDGIGDGDGRANLILTYEGDATRAGVHVGDGGARLELRDDRGKTIWSRP